MSIALCVGAQSKLQVRICRMQADVQIIRSAIVIYKTILGVLLRSHSECNQLRPVSLLRNSRRTVNGSEDQPALEGKQQAQIDYTERPVKPFILLLQIKAFCTRSKERADALSLFDKQNRAIRIQLAFSQLPPRGFDTLRKFLFPHNIYCCSTVGILIKIPRNQLMNVHLRGAQSCTPVVVGDEHFELLWFT